MSYHRNTEKSYPSGASELTPFYVAFLVNNLPRIHQLQLYLADMALQKALSQLTFYAPSLTTLTLSKGYWLGPGVLLPNALVGSTQNLRDIRLIGFTPSWNAVPSCFLNITSLDIQYKSNFPGSAISVWDVIPYLGRCPQIQYLKLLYSRMHDVPTMPEFSSVSLQHLLHLSLEGAAAWIAGMIQGIRHPPSTRISYAIKPTSLEDDRLFSEAIVAHFAQIYIDIHHDNPLRSVRINENGETAQFCFSPLDVTHQPMDDKLVYQAQLFLELDCDFEALSTLLLRLVPLLHISSAVLMGADFSTKCVFSSIFEDLCSAPIQNLYIEHRRHVTNFIDHLNFHYSVETTPIAIQNRPPNTMSWKFLCRLTLVGLFSPDNPTRSRHFNLLQESLRYRMIYGGTRLDQLVFRSQNLIEMPQLVQLQDSKLQELAQEVFVGDDSLSLLGKSWSEQGIIGNSDVDDASCD